MPLPRQLPVPYGRMNPTGTKAKGKKTNRNQRRLLDAFDASMRGEPMPSRRPKPKTGAK